MLWNWLIHWNVSASSGEVVFPKGEVESSTNTTHEFIWRKKRKPEGIAEDVDWLGSLKGNLLCAETTGFLLFWMVLSELGAFSGIHTCTVIYLTCRITNILHGVDLAWTPKTGSKSTLLCLPLELSAVLCHCSRIAVGSYWHPEPILSWYKRPKIESTDSNVQQVEVDFTLGQGLITSFVIERRTDTRALCPSCEALSVDC